MKLKYKGDLGYEGLHMSFKYDDAVFKIENLANGRMGLVYVGDGTNLSRLKIPKGLKVCDYMFAECTSISIPPDISDGVISCSGMFKGCSSLKEPCILPDSVEQCDSMYDECESLFDAYGFTQPYDLSQSAKCVRDAKEKEKEKLKDDNELWLINELKKRSKEPNKFTENFGKKKTVF